VVLLAPPEPNRSEEKFSQDVYGGRAYNWECFLDRAIFKCIHCDSSWVDVASAPRKIDRGPLRVTGIKGQSFKIPTN
jgi:hypothetical protein